MHHLARLTARLGFVSLLALTSLPAQTPAPLAFDVATVKPAQMPTQADMMAGKIHAGIKIETARVDIGLTSMADLIRTAYGVKAYQVTGPDWMTTERFDILAKMPEGSTKEQVPEMLKTLLADRFKLVIHKETKPHAMYALIVGKGGSKLKEALPDPVVSEEGAPAGKGGIVMNTGEGAVRINQNSDGKGGAVVSDAKGNVTKMTPGADGNLHMEASKIDMPAFAEMITRFVDKPVVDETGLKGKYQVALDLSMQDIMRVARSAGMAVPGPGGGGPGGPGGGASAADAASDPGSGGSVFTGIQALGLKLDPRKDPVEMIVVDHIEKAPSDN